MNKVRIFLSPIRELSRHFSLLMLVSVLRWTIQFSYVYIMKYIAWGIQHSNAWVFWFWISILIAAIAVNFAIQFFNNYYINIVMSKTSSYLNATYLKRFLQLDNNIVEQYGTWRMSSIFQKWIVSWLTLLRELTTSHVRIVTVFLITLVYLGLQGWRFLLAGVWIVVVMTLRIKFFNKKIEVYRRKWKEIVGEIDRMLVRWIMSKFEILQLGKYDMEILRDVKLQRQWALTRIKEKLRASLSYDGVAFLLQIAVAAMLIYIGYFAIQGKYWFDEYVFFVWLMTLFNGIINDVSGIGKQYSDLRIHIDKLYNVLYDNSQQSETTFSGDVFVYKTWAIQFDDVSYTYGKGKVIDNLSFSLQWWKKIAFVWPSGGGKTTITKLISWYLQPTQWKIFIDWQDLSKINISSYYRHLGYLTQDALIFDGTVRENLVYACASAPTEEQMKDALLLAKCEFVFDLAEWLDTEIGERGIRLSGWQRQRLAIAKLFLKDPEIIILDEPTSALDSINEQAVTEAFNNLFAWRTVIIIAHRLQTVKQADEILMIENGKVVERGTHETLSVAWGTYQRMLELQSWFVG